MLTSGLRPDKRPWNVAPDAAIGKGGSHIHPISALKITAFTPPEPSISHRQARNTYLIESRLSPGRRLTSNLRIPRRGSSSIIEEDAEPTGCRFEGMRG